MKLPARLNEKLICGRAVRTLAALILAVAAANGWSQEPAKPAAEPAPAATEAKPDAPAPAEKTPAPAEAPASSTTTPASSTTTPATTENATAEGEKAPERFIPTQKSSADNSATFPIDI
jgi:hypothetical protein